MSKWTTADIPDQSGKFAIVTGANSGIGFSAARELARRGCRVVLACRNASKGQAAKARIETDVPGAAVEVCELNLASLASIRAFAAQIVDRGQPLDLLINNAAVMAMTNRQITADGFELQFGTNHLGHFALTGLLMPMLLFDKTARVVTIASIAHKDKRIHFEDLQAEHRYKPWNAYGQSKLANLMFGLELDRWFRRSGVSALSLIAHPGLSKTSIIANGPGTAGGIGPWLMQASFAIAAQSADQGALPMLYAGTSPTAAGGKYYGPDGLFEWRGFPTEAKVSDIARDETAARKLWDISEQLTGVKYDNVTQ